MPTVVTDIFESQLLLTGVDTYVSGMNRAAAATNPLEARLNRLNQISTVTGVAAIGIAAALGKAAMAAGDEAAAMQRASISFQSHGKSFPTAELAAFSSEMQGLTGVADDQIAGFLGLLGTFDLTKEQAKEFAPAILDAAEALKAQGVTTEQLAVQVGKALQTGEVGALRRSGIIIDEVRAKTDLYGAVLEGVAKQGAGAAVAFRQTLPGAMMAAKNAAGDLQEALGTPLIEPLTAVANLGVKLAQGFTNLSPPVQKAVSFLGIGLAGALWAVSLATKAAAAQTVWLMRAQLQATKPARDYAIAQGEAALANTAQGATAGTAAGVGTAGKIAGAANATGTVAGATAGTVGRVAGVKAATTGALRFGLKALPIIGTIITAAELAHLLVSTLQTTVGVSPGMVPTRPGAAPAGEKAKPQTPQDKTNELLEKQNKLLEEIKGDLNAGVGSSDVIDVMGEARVLRLLAGKMAG